MDQYLKGKIKYHNDSDTPEAIAALQMARNKLNELIENAEVEIE